MKTYITRGLGIIGNINSKSEAFKIAWETARDFMELQNRLFPNDTMTVKDWFNVFIKITLKRFYNPVEILVNEIEKFYKSGFSYRFNQRQYIGD